MFFALLKDMFVLKYVSEVLRMQKTKILKGAKRMKRTNLIINKLMALCMCIMLFLQGAIPIMAQEQYVSKEVVLERVESLCEEYDVTIEFVSYNDSLMYTIEEVDKELERLEEDLKQYQKYHYIYVNDPVNINSRVMELDKTYTSYVYADNGLSGGAQIEISCDAKINLGSISFISVKNISTRQYGIATNFVSWTQNDSYYSYLEGGRLAEVVAEGTLVTEMELLGQRTRYTYDHVIGMIINAAGEG